MPVLPMAPSFLYNLAFCPLLPTLGSITRQEPAMATITLL